MNSTVRLILTIGLSFVLLISLLGLVFSQFLQATFFSLDFFERSIVSSNYINKVREAIDEDFAGQAAYVGVPDEVLTAGLDDTRLYLLIVDHLENINEVLRLQSEYQPVIYPAEPFYTSLAVFINEYAAENNITVSQEQLNQLQEVATDSAAIVARHINLFDLDLVAGTSLFARALGILNRMAGWGALSIVLILVSLGGLFAINGRQWRRSLLSITVTFWLTGSLMLVPSLVLHWFGLPRRLSLGTGYLKLAADNWLSNANNYVLTVGSVILLISTAYLLVHFFLAEKRRHRTHKRTVMSQNDMISLN